MLRADIGDDRRRERPWRRWQKPGEHRLGVGAQQRPELGAAIGIEENELALALRQAGMQGLDHGSRAHGEVDDGLKGEHGRQLNKPAGLLVPAEIGLQRHGHSDTTGVPR